MRQATFTTFPDSILSDAFFVALFLSPLSDFSTRWPHRKAYSHVNSVFLWLPIVPVVDFHYPGHPRKFYLEYVLGRKEYLEAKT